MCIIALYAKQICKVKGPEEMEEDRISGNILPMQGLAHCSVLVSNAYSTHGML